MTGEPALRPDNGRSSLLGTILGAVAGGAVGLEIDRSSSRDLRCR